MASPKWVGVETRPSPLFGHGFLSRVTGVVGPLVVAAPAEQPQHCRLKLQRKKSRQKRCQTQSCVAIHYCICTWPYFVGACCCSFDGNMGNMVNRLLGCLGRAKTRGQGRVIFCGLGDTGLELDVVWANIDPTYIDTVRSLS